MSAEQIIGLVAGAFVGYIVAGMTVSPRYRHLGSGWFQITRRMGFGRGCLLTILWIAIGAGAGYLVATLLTG
jgi:hypothetical protein